MEQDHKVLPSETRYYLTLLKLSRRPGLQALAKSTFLKVPPEILELIVGYLPVASAACFSICCQPLAAALGPRHLHKLRIEPGTKDRNVREFMSLLGRDLPNATECYKCMVFHTDGEVRRHIPSNWHHFYPPPCWKEPGKRDGHFGWDHRERYLLHYNFSIPTFQTTMRHYREGLEYRDLLESLTSPTTTSSRPNWKSRGRVMQHSSQPQLVSGSLILRTKIAFLEPEHDLRNSYFIICPHSGILNSGSAVARFKTILSETVRYYDSTLRNGSDAEGRAVAWIRCWLLERSPEELPRDVNEKFAPGNLHQCNYCATEFRIDFEILKGKSAMFITKWQDLGDGEDGKWRKQLVGPEGPTDTLVHFEAGSICETFQTGETEERNKGVGDEWLLTSNDKKELLNPPDQW